MGEKLDAIGQFICMGIMLYLGSNEKEGLLACIGATLQLIVFECVFQTGIAVGKKEEREKPEWERKKEIKAEEDYKKYEDAIKREKGKN